MCVLGKIVKSNSHTDYVCQIFGQGEADYIPQTSDYSFGTFVQIGLDNDGNCNLVGVIYDTALVNPDFGRFGPRLSPETELRIFSPDYLNERVVLTGIIVIGQTVNGLVQQGVPLLAATHEAYVQSLEPEAITRFHTSSGGFRLAYLPNLLAQSGVLARDLALCVIGQLDTLMPENGRILQALADDLSWQLHINSMRDIHG